MEIMTVCETGFEPLLAHEGDAGADLRACIVRPVEIAPNTSEWIGTGMKVAIPDGYVGLLFPRSGLGCKHGICLANGVGVIDSGYRGEIRAKLLNLGTEPYRIYPRDRICQLVIVPYAKADYKLAIELDKSERGEDGYGSTGVL